jgi:hypothetical protein
VATFIIETYLSRAGTGDLEDATVRLRTAIARVATADRQVRHIRSFYVPADEMAIHLVEAAALEDAVRLGAEAGLTPDRIVEVEPAAG